MALKNVYKMYTTKERYIWKNIEWLQEHRYYTHYFLNHLS